jgi:hypothetical protein
MWTDLLRLLGHLQLPAPYVVGLVVLAFLNQPVRMLLAACVQTNITLCRRLQIVLAGIACIAVVPIAFWFIVRVVTFASVSDNAPPVAAPAVRGDASTASPDATRTPNH